MNKRWMLPVWVALLGMLLSMVVCGDMGPKAAVHVTFEHMGDTLCYGTLLSEHPSTGPQSVWDGDEERIYDDDFGREVWQAFVDYEDADGYYFLQTGGQVNEKKALSWTYYPPQRFKILLYYPETGTFAVSGICERYAFDTYYTVDMQGVTMGAVEYDEERSTDERIEAYRSYNYWRELKMLGIRIVLTILLELAVALLFGYRRREFWLLAGVNVVTQVVLNLLLNLVNYHSGQWALVANYVLFELVVLGLEAVAFTLWLPRLSTRSRPRWLPAVYALVANVLSFVAGLFLALWLPDVF